MSEENLPENIVNMYQLDTIDHQILQLTLKYPGIKNRELAAIVKERVNDISFRRNKPAFKEALKEMLKSVYERIEKAQIEAIDKLRKHIRSPNEAISLKACEIILSPLLKVQDSRQAIGEIVHKVHFGEKGELYSQTIEVNQKPKSVIEVLPEDAKQ